MYKRLFLKRPRGMSIVEIFIAYTILLVAVLALLGSLPMAARQRGESIIANQALYFAEQKMDELVRNDMKLSTASEFQDNPLNDDTMVRTWKGEIGTNSTVETITVKVTWLTRHGQREIVLRSYLHI
ncbi:hypothetical protein IJT17_02160 [bacterium]|nr:hypothetical protein [bacterium]